MNAVTNITAKIVEDAKAKAAGIVSEAEAQAREKINRARDEAECSVKAAKEKLVLRSESAFEREVAAMRLYKGKTELQKKRDYLDEAFQKTVEALSGMEDDAYRGLFKRMFIDTAEEGCGTVTICEADAARIDVAFLKEICEMLSIGGALYDYRLDEQYGSFKGGFIINRTGLLINCSFEALLRWKREALETDVAELLFGEYTFNY